MKSEKWKVKSENGYPELCLAIIDYLATAEGSMTMWYGPKGMTWDYDDEGGAYFTALGKDTNRDPSFDMTGTVLVGPRTGKEYPQSGTYNDGALQINNTTLTSSQQNLDSKKQETLDKVGWVSVLAADLKPIQQAWCDWAGAASTQQYLENHPYKVMLDTGTYAPAKRDQVLDTKWSQIQTAVKTYSWRAIYAKNDGEFNYHMNQMIKDCNAYGYADCVAWCQEQAALCWAAQQDQAALVQ